MQILPVSSATKAVATPAPKPTSDDDGAISTNAWSNPAAAAALHSGVDLLGEIEAGILRNFGDATRVSEFASSLRSTISVFDSAVTAITSDSSKENDAFLPLLDTAGGGVSHAQLRLSSKELTSFWPTERNEILAAIRKARSISQNVADQLDPRSFRSAR